MATYVLARVLDGSMTAMAWSVAEHAESGAVLTTVAEDLFRQGQFDLAIAVGQAVVTKVPPVDASQSRTAWTVIAHSQFDIGQYGCP
jgi:hypothetical protein